VHIPYYGAAFPAALQDKHIRTRADYFGWFSALAEAGVAFGEMEQTIVSADASGVDLVWTGVIAVGGVDYDLRAEQRVAFDDNDHMVKTDSRTLYFAPASRGYQLWTAALKHFLAGDLTTLVSKFAPDGEFDVHIPYYGAAFPAALQDKHIRTRADYLGWFGDIAQAGVKFKRTKATVLGADESEVTVRWTALMAVGAAGDYDVQIDQRATFDDDGRFVNITSKMLHFVSAAFAMNKTGL